VECRLLLSEVDLELLCGLLEECRVFRNHIDPRFALAHRVAPNGNKIYARFFESAEHLRSFAGFIGNNH
jgi:hypothetical protein